MSERTRPQAGVACLTLFLIPFCGVGVVTAALAIRDALAGDWRQAGFLAIFAFAFGGVGFGLLSLTLTAGRRAREVARLQAAHPDEPWKWRTDWAVGRLECSTRTTMAAAWWFAVLWNAIAAPGSVAAMNEFLVTGQKTILLVLLFPAVGIGLVTWAVRETIRHRKFGVTQLEMARVPGVIGKGIGGLLRTSIPMRPAGGFEATLTCVNRITSGGGKNRSTRERIRWQESMTIRDFLADPAAAGTVIPVAFRLPRDVDPSDDRNPNNRTLWRLEVIADVPGVDFRAAFEVPVFRTAESVDRDTFDEDTERLAATAKAPYHQPPGSRIVVTESLRGVEIVFPAGRTPGAAAGITVFFSIWSVILFVLVRVDAPIIFPVIWGLFDVLLAYGVLSSWLGVTRVVAGPESIEIASGLLAPTRTKRLDSGAVREIEPRVGMQMGSTPYYDVTIVGTDGVKCKAGSNLRDKREAEWLAGRMKVAIGLGKETGEHA